MLEYPIGTRIKTKQLVKDYTAKKPIPEVVTADTIYRLGTKIPRPGVRGLFYFTYLTGARITEAILVKRSDIDLGYHKGEPFIHIKLRTLKRKDAAKFRVLPIPVTEKYPTEKAMWDYVKPFIQKVFEGPIWRFRGTTEQVRHMAKHYFKRYIEISSPAIHGMKFLESYTFRLYPHYLRHCRLTHLAQNYGYRLLDLMQFAGWTDPKPAIIYIHFNWTTLAEQMIRSKE